MFWKFKAKHFDFDKGACFTDIDHDSLNDIISSHFQGKKIVGDAGENFLKGTWGDDFIVANNGNDCIFGQIGDDFILGNGGDDYIEGGWGDDSLHAGPGDDFVKAGRGDDYISGGFGHDTLIGGSGCDTFLIKVSKPFLGESFDTILDFRIGTDKLELNGGDQTLASFVDVGHDVLVLYDGVEMALLKGVNHIPADTDVFFG